MKNISEDETVARQPLTKGIAVYAAFKWISTSWKNDPINFGRYLFPYFAAKEQDGTSSDYLLSRLRSYVIDKLEIPPERIALFVHAIASLDAFQLIRCFTAWKILAMKNYEATIVFKRNAMRKCLRKWYRDVLYLVQIRAKVKVITIKHQIIQTKHFYKQWLIHYRAMFMWESKTRRRLMRKALKHWHRLHHSTQIIDYSKTNASVYSHRKAILQVFTHWLRHLCPLSRAAWTLAHSPQITPWLQDHLRYLLFQRVISRMSITSLSLDHPPNMGIYANLSKSFLKRSVYYTKHQLYRYLLSQQEEYQSTIEEKKRSIYALRKVTRLLQSNLISFVSQSSLIRLSIRYNSQRKILLALRQWMLWTIQSFVSRCQVVATRASSSKSIRFPSRSRSPLKQSPTKTEEISIYFHQKTKLQQALYFWFQWSRSKKRVYHQYLLVKHRNHHRIQHKAYGIWLILTARSQDLARKAHKVTNKKFLSTLVYIFFIWKLQYLKFQSIKTNQKYLYQAQLQEFYTFQKLLQQSNMLAPSSTVSSHRYSLLQQWSLFLHQQQKGMRVMHLWYKLHRFELLSKGFSQWKASYSYEILVTILQAMYRGYRIRRLYFPHVYQYLQEYRTLIPLALQFKHHSLQRRYYQAWKHKLSLHYTRFHQHYQQFHQHFLLKLWKNSLQSKQKSIQQRQKQQQAMNCYHERNYLTYWKLQYYFQRRKKFSHQLIFDQCQSMQPLQRQFKRLKHWAYLKPHEDHCRIRHSQLYILRKHIQYWKSTQQSYRIQWKAMNLQRIRLFRIFPKFVQWKQRTQIHLIQLEKTNRYHRRSQLLRALRRWRYKFLLLGQYKWRFPMFQHHILHSSIENMTFEKPSINRITRKSISLGQKIFRFVVKKHILKWFSYHQSRVTSHQTLTHASDHYQRHHMRQCLRQLYHYSINNHVREQTKQSLIQETNFFVKQHHKYTYLQLLIKRLHHIYLRHEKTIKSKQSYRIKQFVSKQYQLLTQSWSGATYRWLKQWHYYVQIYKRKRKINALLVQTIDQAKITHSFDRWKSKIVHQRKQRRTKYYYECYSAMKRIKAMWFKHCKISKKYKQQFKLLFPIPYLPSNTPAEETTWGFSTLNMTKRGDQPSLFKSYRKKYGITSTTNAYTAPLTTKELIYQHQQQSMQRHSKLEQKRCHHFLHRLITAIIKKKQSQNKFIKYIWIKAKHFLEQLKVMVYLQHVQGKLSPEARIIRYKEYQHRIKLIENKYQQVLRWKLKKAFIKLGQRKRNHYRLRYIGVSYWSNQLRQTLYYWSNWKYLQKKLRTCKRRFYLIPSMKHWLQVTIEQFKSRRVVTKVTKLTNFNLKKNNFLAWKEYTQQQTYDEKRYCAVFKRALHWQKKRIFAYWLIAWDQHYLTKKFAYVQQQARWNTMLRTLKQWQQLYIQSEYLSWKNAKILLTYWKDYTRRKQYLITLGIQSKTWYHQKLFHIFVRQLQYNIQRQSLKSTSILRLHKFLANQYRTQMTESIRLWKRKMFLRYHCDFYAKILWLQYFMTSKPSFAYMLHCIQPLIQVANPLNLPMSSTTSTMTSKYLGYEDDTSSLNSSFKSNYQAIPAIELFRQLVNPRLQYPKTVSDLPKLYIVKKFSNDELIKKHSYHRAMVKWHRFCKLRHYLRSIRRIQHIFHTWKHYSFKMHLLRQAYRQRLTSYYRTSLLTTMWSHWLQYHRLSQRSLYIQTITQHKLLQQSYSSWYYLIQQKQHLFYSMHRMFSLLTKAKLPLYFRIWRIKTLHAVRIYNQRILYVAMQSWYRNWIATRYRKTYLTLKCLQAWKGYVQSTSKWFQILLLRRQLLSSLVLRKQRKEYSMIKIGFIRWKIVNILKLLQYQRLTDEKPSTNYRILDLQEYMNHQHELQRLFAYDSHNRLLRQLKTSQIGRWLLFPEPKNNHIESVWKREEIQFHEKNSPIKLPRLIEIQSRMAERCDEEKEYDRKIYPIFPSKASPVKDWHYPNPSLPTNFDVEDPRPMKTSIDLLKERMHQLIHNRNNRSQMSGNSTLQTTVTSSFPEYIAVHKPFLLPTSPRGRNYDPQSSRMNAWRGNHSNDRAIDDQDVEEADGLGGIAMLSQRSRGFMTSPRPSDLPYTPSTAPRIDVHELM